MKVEVLGEILFFKIHPGNHQSCRDFLSLTKGIEYIRAVTIERVKFCRCF